MPDLSASGNLGKDWPKLETEHEMLDFFARHNAYAAVLWDTGDVVGGYGIRLDQLQEAWFYYFVLTPWQGQGFGGELLKLVEMTARETTKTKSLWARCSKANAPSVSALVKAGFVENPVGDESGETCFFKML